MEPSDEVDPAVIEDNSHILVSSRRVEGTPVFDCDGRRIGSVHSVMIHKVTGQVAYAVLTFGGVLGIGSHAYPVPWQKLAYAKADGGYRIDISRKEIEAAPTLRLDEADRPTSRPYEERLYDYYRAPHYWTY